MHSQKGTPAAESSELASRTLQVLRSARSNFRIERRRTSCTQRFFPPGLGANNCDFAGIAKEQSGHSYMKVAPSSKEWSAWLNVSRLIFSTGRTQIVMISSSEQFNEAEKPESSGGRATLFLVFFLASPYLMELPIVIVQHLIAIVSSAHSQRFLTTALPLLAILGSVTVSVAGVIAIATLFRPRVSWERKGLIWFVIVMAGIVHKLAWRYALERP